MHCFSDLSHASLDYSYREMFSASWLNRECELVLADAALFIPFSRPLRVITFLAAFSASSDAACFPRDLNDSLEDQHTNEHN